MLVALLHEVLGLVTFRLQPFFEPKDGSRLRRTLGVTLVECKLYY